MRAKCLCVLCLFYTWLVVIFGAAVVSSTDMTGGFGTPDDFATWIGNERGGLRFPVYNEEVYNINPSINIEEVCENTLEDAVDSGFTPSANSSCQYDNSTKKTICKRLIDYDYIKDVNSMTSLIVTEYYRGQQSSITPESFLMEQSGTIPDEMWKSTSEIYPNNLGLGLRISADLTPNEAYNGVILEGDAFSNEIQVGWRFTGQAIADLKRGLLNGNGGTAGPDSGWNINVTAARVNQAENLQNWLLEGSVHIDQIHSTVCFDGAVAVKTMSSSGTWNIAGSVKLKEIPMVYNIDSTLTSTSIEEITIPRLAFSEVMIKHIFFKDSYFLRDFDKDAFQDLRGVSTLTFENSKLEEIPRLDYLLAHLPELKALYIRRSATPNLIFGQDPALPNVELVSLEGSGPLQLTNSTFKVLSNSSLKYLNLQDSNLKLAHDTGPILSQVRDTLTHLDLSYTSLSSEDDLYRMLDGLKLSHLSLAGLQLQKTPKDALELIKDTIKYLTFKGNNFLKIPDENLFYISLAFPSMPLLKELDLRNCEINYIDKGSFDMLPALKKLYLSHNRIENLQDGWVNIDPPMTYMDLSYNSVTTAIPSATSLAVKVSLSLNLFSKLIILDLSNGVFTDVETLVTQLPSSLIALSISNTGLKSMSDELLGNKMNLLVLDVSNNPQMLISEPLSIAAFNNLKSLKYLHLKNCRISDLFFYNVKNAIGENVTSVLEKLEYVDLSLNNIKMVDPLYFRYFPSLRMIDLSSNSITEWKEPLISQHSKIETIFMDDNKIDKLSEVMLSDIYKMRTVKLGNNPFVCGCYVVDLTDKVMSVKEGYVCGATSRNGLAKGGATHGDFFAARKYDFGVRRKREVGKSEQHMNDMEIVEDIQEKLLRSIAPGCISNLESEQEHRTDLDYCLQLLDWSSGNYECFSSRARPVPFQNYSDTTNCTSDSFQDFENDFVSFLYIGAGVIVFLGAIVGLLYWKWWDIRLITKAVKEAAMLTLIDKQIPEHVPFLYNVFVSYSDKDRSWVLDHLLPNLESWDDFKVCLHERDFQVGLSILENIISSIDRSQAIILVLSQSFVRSQWCQFEMHLAQHRLLETRRDQLILILLEPIPKISRPTTLQYLMRTKTYVQWPGYSALHKHKHEFWNRLFKALLRNNPQAVTV